MSQWYWDVRAICLVEIKTDEGITGWGECFGPAETNAALIKELYAPQLIGRDPLPRRHVWETLYNRTREFGRKGIAISALSGIDIALWDIYGQYVNQPIGQLLGGDLAQPVAAYASTFYYSADNARVIEENAAQAIGEGFSAFKMKVGALSIEEDAQRVRNVRQCIGDSALLAVDANRAYTANEAIALGKRIAPYDIAWFEEPVLPDDFAGYREVRNKLDMRIAGGESEFTRFGFRSYLEQQCIDIAQPDVAACGGISEALTIAQMATAYGIECYPHQWGSAISLAATLHLTSAIPLAVPAMAKQRPVLELDRAPNIFREQLSDLAIGPVMQVPQRPGLGIEIDFDMIKHYST
ncbi:mandelate racemase/muconate lactonizing enzyme family protein [Candidatus Sodalis sp. SoCistrobi]|uniref:mandelate racemase/muconate lactonizing enzyme family protein n=1 Tax=Candidatus Sodalis sp. SoCistrobi TaxID=1922216 RepID=UPI0015768481|nr:mandelate racemase/muconate lactonizing enzyme family protein [Candidatus Sodalis sp. SoCistrobi]